MLKGSRSVSHALRRGKQAHSKLYTHRGILFCDTSLRGCILLNVLGRLWRAGEVVHRLFSEYCGIGVRHAWES